MDNLSAAFGQCGFSGDAAFAKMLDDFAAEALKDGNLDDAGYFWDASDWHAVPSDGTVAARMMLMVAAMERAEAGR